MVNIIKNYPRFGNELLEAYKDQSSATVHEAMGRRGAMDHTIKSIARGMKIVGCALTVRCHAGDNIMLIKAISMAKTGDVIVADMGRIQDAGPFGEVLATECVMHGMAGLIVTGSVRDSKEIIEMGFPVFASNLSISGTAKATLGTINHPISCGGEVVRPGDLILGDDDGVVVIPPDEAWNILMAANERTKKEANIKERILAGESLFDIYGYQKVFDSLHCVEEESEENK